MSKEVKQNKRIRSNESEDKKKSEKYNGKKILSLRLHPEERALLEMKANEEGWATLSGFIRYKLLGMHVDDDIRKRIGPGQKTNIGILLKNISFEIANDYDYFKYRYEKDMRQLYREEGVDIDKWIQATNIWHALLLEKTKEMLRYSRMIASALELEEYFDKPSDHMTLSEEPTQQEMDALAEQLRKERIAYGHTDEF